MILVLKNARKFRQVALHAYLCSGASGALYNFSKWYAGGAIYCNFIRLAHFQNNGSLIEKCKFSKKSRRDLTGDFRPAGMC